MENVDRKNAIYLSELLIKSSEENENLTSERDRYRAERDELIEMIEGLLICIAGKSHAMQNVINRIQEVKK